MAAKATRHPSTLTGHRPKRELTQVETDTPIAAPRAPAMPRGVQWSTEARAAWGRIWKDRITEHWGRGPAYQLVVQYITYYDAWLSLMEAALEDPTVDGSKGQTRANPLFAEARHIDEKMQTLEGKLWLSPQAALHAGIERVHGLHALRRLGKTAEGPEDDPDDVPPDGWTFDT